MICNSSHSYITKQILHHMQRQASFLHSNSIYSCNSIWWKTLRVWVLRLQLFEQCLQFMYSRTKITSLFCQISVIGNVKRSTKLHKEEHKTLTNDTNAYRIYCFIPITNQTGIPQMKRTGYFQEQKTHYDNGSQEDLVNL